MTKSELTKLGSLQGKCSYNQSNKAEFRRLGMKLARELRKELGLTSETADVRYNAGGIAVSGDVILHTDNIYLTFNADGISSGLGIMYRHCKSRKDYGTGTSTPNHWYRWDYLVAVGVVGLVRSIRRTTNHD